MGAFAAGLRARGARRGDVLTLVATNGPDFPVAMHGALAAGLTLAPASPLLTARELGAFVRQVRARFVVADDGAMATAARGRDAPRASRRCSRCARCRSPGRPGPRPSTRARSRC